MSYKFPDLDELGRRLGGSLSDAWRKVVSPERDPAASADIAVKAAASAPVVWLVGKVQSGKSSIVQALTGASAAEVGSGFKACTASAQMFDYPADAPAIRFLDTRGLGEAGYDPAADIAVAEEQSHLLLVVMRATDTAQAAVLEVVAAARKKHPGWPVLVAQSCLHEAYGPGKGHPERYMFDVDGKPLAMLPGDLDRTIAWQRQKVSEIPGDGPIAFVPLDFTKSDDGYQPQYYGLEALRAALLRVAPGAVATALVTSAGRAVEGRTERARQHILGFATAAAAADVVPVAGAVAVPAVQAKMLHSLGEIHGVAWDRRMVGEMSGALGAGVLARMLTSFGARQVAKLVPIYGQTAGAATAATLSFVTTYALGIAASVYLQRRSEGLTGTDGVKQAYEDALKSAFEMAAQRLRGNSGSTPPPSSPHSGEGGQSAASPDKQSAASPDTIRGKS